MGKKFNYQITNNKTINQKKNISELLEILKQKGLINNNQYQAAIFFKWIHSLRYGCNMPRAYDPSFLGGKEITKETTAERIYYEQLCQKSLLILKNYNLEKLIPNICIYNYYSSNIDVINLKHGLNLLYKFYYLKRNKTYL